MSLQGKCARCGAPLYASALGSRCPKCLFAYAFDPEAAAADRPTGLVSDASRATAKRIYYFGDYELVQEIARGGMGLVWKARQVSLNRMVAVKLLLTGKFSSPHFVKRFQTEAEAAANLQHPNIVAIYEVGEHEGQHYFAMELVEGENLAERVRGNPLPQEQAAEYLKTIAEAIHYAHQRGILHRDIKPSNVLIDALDRPRITDFGLAKRLDGDSDMTLSGQVIGTPHYMSPEQARGRQTWVTVASDIYSLGAVLYFLLTGRPPFDGESIEGVLEGVLHREPTSPRLLNPSISRDLETICLKCLSKEPAGRYPSAQALGEDVSRWLRHEPILARSVGPRERFWRWCRRKPGLAGSLALISILLLIVMIGSPVAVTRINRERQRSDHLLYLANMSLAQQAWEHNDGIGIQKALEETRDSPDRRFEWYYWQRQTHLALKTIRGAPGPLLWVAYSPDGERILGGCAGASTALVWDAASGQQLLRFQPQGPFDNNPFFSPDGRQVLFGGTNGTAKVFDTATRQEICSFAEHSGAIGWSAFSSDGRWIITGGADSTAMVWSATTGEKRHTLKGHKGEVSAVAFSPDGRLIATGDYNSLVIVWDAATGRELFRRTSKSEGFGSVNFSPDSKRLLTTGWAQLTVWELAERRELLEILHGLVGANYATFSPDGQRIIASGSDHVVKLWDANNGQEMLTRMGHTDEVAMASFSPDGQQFVSASLDRTVKLWDIQSRHQPFELRGHSNQLWSVAFSSKGDRIVTGSADRTARLWDALSGRELFPLKSHNDVTFSAAFSPDCDRILTGGEDHTGKLWDAANGVLLRTFKGHSNRVRAVAFFPNGKQMVTGSSDKTAKVWDVLSGKCLLTLSGHMADVFSVACSPDGSKIVTGSLDTTARVWDTTTGLELLAFKEHKGNNSEVYAVTFASGGRTVVSAGADKRVRVWDATNGRELLVLKGHNAAVLSVAISSDGKRILTGSQDRTAKLWDAETGREFLELKGHSGPVWSVAFSPDGRSILTSDSDGTARVWRAANPAEVAAWQEEERTASDIRHSVNR